MGNCLCEGQARVRVHSKEQPGRVRLRAAGPGHHRRRGGEAARGAEKAPRNARGNRSAHDDGQDRRHLRPFDVRAFRLRQQSESLYRAVLRGDGLFLAGRRAADAVPARDARHPPVFSVGNGRLFRRAGLLHHAVSAPGVRAGRAKPAGGLRLHRRLRGRGYRHLGLHLSLIHISRSSSTRSPARACRSSPWRQSA